jgi:hypothetical protein
MKHQTNICNQELMEFELLSYGEGGSAKLKGNDGICLGFMLAS